MKTKSIAKRKTNEINSSWKQWNQNCRTNKQTSFLKLKSTEAEPKIKVENNEIETAEPWILFAFVIAFHPLFYVFKNLSSLSCTGFEFVWVCVLWMQLKRLERDIVSVEGEFVTGSGNAVNFLLLMLLHVGNLLSAVRWGVRFGGVGDRSGNMKIGTEKRRWKGILYMIFVVVTGIWTPFLRRNFWCYWNMEYRLMNTSKGNFCC